MALSISNHKPILIACLAIFTSAITVDLNRAFAANEVKTKQLIVPVEGNKPSSDTTKPDVQVEEPTLEIPRDALPNLDPNSVGIDDDDDEDAETASPLPDETPVPEVMRDLSKLPPPVRRMHTLLLEAARNGNIESLRNLLGIGETATNLSIGGVEGDPIEFLKEASGDELGYEILAILIEVLEAGFVHIDPGTDSELYVWPYFFAVPLDSLTPQQNVELFRILTAGDVQDSVDFGGYIFYRVGIKPDGRWDFFVAGD